MCVCVFVYVYVFVFVCVCVCVRVYMCVCVCHTVPLLVELRQVQGVHKHTAGGQRLRHFIKHSEGTQQQLDLPSRTPREREGERARGEGKENTEKRMAT